MRGAVLLQVGKCADVGEGVAANGHGDVIAAEFSFVAEVAGDPPHGWVVEEERFGDALQNVDQVIVAADVSEFVGEQGFDLFGGKSGEGANGHEDNGAEPADYGGDLDDCRG